MSPRKIIFAAMIALTVCSSPLPASESEDPSGWKEIANYRGWKIISLRLTGLEKQVAREIGQGLELAEEGAVLYERSLGQDIERIRLFLSLRGYPYSAVSPSISPAEEGKELSLDLHVDPGPPVIVRSVEITGLPDQFRETVQNRTRMKAGSVFSDAALAADKSAIVEILSKAGHARARACLLYTSPSPRDRTRSRMPSSA